MVYWENVLKMKKRQIKTEKPKYLKTALAANNGWVKKGYCCSALDATRNTDLDPQPTERAQLSRHQRLWTYWGAGPLHLLILR